MSFKAIRVDKADKGVTARFVEMDESELLAGEVTVRVTHSTVNYKDGLVLGGRSGIVNRFPMVAGIDFAGIVESSASPGFVPGDEVLVNGFGLSQSHFGGYAQKARVPAKWLIRVPQGLTRAQSMAIGTAGFTAALCVLALERARLAPKRGPVLVTGAAGGVGSVAVALLSAAGWSVTASTGRTAEAEYLRDLGATEIIDRAELSAPGRPLGKERWAAVVDSVGSTTLVNALAQTRYGGAVAACGLAQGPDLPGTVLPFILRGVSLIGVDSVNCPMQRRLYAWKRLARDLDRRKLENMTRTIQFDDVFAAGADILNGKIRGRVVVEIG
jgi:acrylyl-CoA reductase (NADPH)